MQVSKIVLQQYPDDETKDYYIAAATCNKNRIYNYHKKNTVTIISRPVFSCILLYSAVVVHMKSR